MGVARVFFLMTCLRLFPISRARPGAELSDAEINYARMVVCALAGFAVTSQFITVYGIEVPYYMAIIGAGVLKLRAATPRTAAVTSSTTGSIASWCWAGASPAFPPLCGRLGRGLRTSR